MLLAQTGSSGSSFGLILIVVLIAAMYFLMIRPQNKRRREAQQMQNTLRPGNEIVTIGGMHATVTSIEDDVVTLEIAPGVYARYARAAIAQVKAPGTSEGTSGSDGTDAQNTIEQG